MITFVKQPDGSYIKSGKVSSRRVCIQIENRHPFGDYTLRDALKIIECGIAQKQAKANFYNLIPLARTLSPKILSRT